MAKSLLSTSKPIKATLYILVLAIILGYANSARILDEALPEASNPLPTPVPTSNPQTNPTTSLRSGQIPTIAPTTTTVDDTEDDADPPIPETDVAPPIVTTVTTVPEADSPQPETEEPATVPAPIADVAPASSTVIQNSGNNNVVSGRSNQPLVTAGQLPTGATLQKLMFGSATVIDDELTEGHELGSAVLGKAQGFYLASSLDGNSHTMAFTVLLHGSHDEVEDTISLFGVHRTASPVSYIAVIGGTGKYEMANGYAAIESLHQEDQHTTDGVDAIMQISVYLSE